MTRQLRTLSLLLLIAGCKASLGATETHPLTVPASKDMRLLQFQLPVAHAFTITAGSTQAMEATVTTNVPDLAPKATESDHLRKFVQRLPSGRTLPDGARNDWQIRLGKDTPLLLDIGAGSLSGDLSLGGLQLIGVNLGVGIESPKIHFDTPNRAEMPTFTFAAGTGTSTITGLSRANARKVDITSGTGSLQLDFAGTLTKTSTADIKGGTGAVTLIIPPTVPARLQITAAVGSVSVPGYTAEGSTYTSPGFNADKPHWEMSIAVGTGAVTVQSQ